MVDKEMINFFFEEVLEMFPKWEAVCLRLEQRPVASDFDELFRYAHNIKGSSKMVGLEILGSFVHKVEDVINLLREKKLELSSEHIDLFLDVHTVLQSWIDGMVKDSNFLPDNSEIMGRIGKILGEEKTKAPVINKTEEDDGGVISININDDLVISRLTAVMDKINFEEGKKYRLILNMEIIDTAGIQWLLALKNFSRNSIKIICNGPQVQSIFRELGLEGRLL